MDSGYTNILNELKNRASKYITIPSTYNTNKNSKYNLLYKHYLIPYILIFLLLVIFRPSFIYDKKLDIKKINIMKSIKIIVITGVAIDIGLFIYSKK
jgi:hypothetical protein